MALFQKRNTNLYKGGGGLHSEKCLLTVFYDNQLPLHFFSNKFFVSPKENNSYSITQLNH